MASNIPTAPTAPAHPKAQAIKQKTVHEFKDFVAISIYLAFFFCALATYSMVLLRKYDVSYVNYSFAIINALVVAKVLLIGDMAHLGRSSETKPLYLTVLHKSVVFTLLVVAFHFLEEVVKRIIHHEPNGTVIHNIRWDDLGAKSLIVFAVFLPLFAFRELRRVLGEDTFYALFRSPGAAKTAD
jgi:hypothetical protein